MTHNKKRFPRKPTNQTKQDFTGLGAIFDNPHMQTLFRNQMAEFVGNAQMGQNKNLLIQRMNQMRQAYVDMCKKNLATMSIAPPTSTKPVVTTRAMTDLKPVYVCDLVLETTHRDRFLSGTTICPPALLTSAHLVLEDARGGLVRVQIPNPAAHHNGLKALKELDKMFPVGVCVRIAEPFFKTFQDGGVGIRVEALGDVEINPTLTGSPLLNTLAYHSDSIAALKTTSPFSGKILTNIALVYLKLNVPLKALSYALAAVLCDSTNYKASYRAALALKDLGHDSIAASFSSLSIKNGGGKPSSDLLKSLSKCNIMEWSSRDVLRSCCNMFRDLSFESFIPLKGNLQELNRLGGVAFSKQAYEMSLLHYKSALKVHLTSICDLFLRQSSAFCNIGDELNAILYATSALCIDQTNPNAHSLRAHYYFNAGEPDTARLACKNGLELVPSDVPLGVLLHELSHTADVHGIGFLSSTALQNGHPLLISCLNNLALIFSKMNQPTYALCYSLAVLYCDPNNSKALYRSAVALKELSYEEVAASLATASLQHGTTTEATNLLNSINCASSQIIPFDSEEAFGVYCRCLSDLSFDNTTPLQGTLEELRGKGSEAFGSKKYKESLNFYQSAVRQYFSAIGFLFSQRSKSEFDKRLFSNCVVSAKCSLLINPLSIGTYRLCSNGYLEMGLHDASRFMCEQGLRLSPEDTSLQSQVNNIIKAKKKMDKEIEKLSQSLETENFERKWINSTEGLSREDPSDSADVLPLLNAVMSTLNVGEHKLPGGPSVSKCPKFHIEFSSHGLWPEDCDINACREYLYQSYHNSSLSQFLSTVSMTKADSLKPEDLLTRLGPGAYDRKTLDWFLKSEEFINPHPIRTQYPTDLHHSYSNTSYAALIMNFGKVHVAIGFVDLGTLLGATFVGKASSSGPLVWHGYEQSCYSVAKTLIIVEMLKGNASANSILQVWFSATWCTPTRKEFLCALERVLSNRSLLDDAVVRVLHHWSQSPVISLSVARRVWLSRQRRFVLECVSSMTELQDRMDRLTYILTGHIGGGREDVGSTVMFCIPADVGALSLSEDVLQCIPFDELMTRRDHPDYSFMKAGQSFLLERIQRLQKLVSDGHIDIQLHHQCVTFDNPKVASEIRSLRPYSVTWSNVLDFMLPKEFVALARMVSAENDTVHVAHTMNWPLRVRGTDLMDMAVQDRKDIIDDSRSVLRSAYSIDPCIPKYLMIAEFGNVRNIANYMLGSARFELWTDNFKTVAGLKENNFTPEGAMYSVFARTNTTRQIAFSFDENIQLQRQYI
jgi:tetratricopeptide (TPR) repeat protein